MFYFLCTETVVCRVEWVLSSGYRHWIGEKHHKTERSADESGIQATL